jgi:hypothetical protein
MGPELDLRLKQLGCVDEYAAEFGFMANPEDGFGKGVPGRSSGWL